MNNSAFLYQRKLWWLILSTMVFKILLSFFLELGNDEVYYYTYAIQPDWNHFDHPPMVGWLIRLTTLNLLWVNTLSMRLGSIIAAAVATKIIFEIGVLLKDERAGWIAALLYSLSIYTSIIAGLFIMPDSPQLVFYVGSVYLMVKKITKPHLFRVLDWLFLGLLIGFATLSKVHGLFLWFAFGAFIVFHQRKILRDPFLYISISITLLCLIPILYWNIQNDFITYQFHSKRVMHVLVSFDHFFQQIIGEFFYQNPIVYIGILWSLLKFKKIVQLVNSKAAIQLLLWLSFPLLLLFWGLSLFNPTLPHWTGPGFIPLFLIAGIYWSWQSKKWVPVLVKYAAAFMFLLVTSFLLLVFVFPKQLGSKNIEHLGEYNPINDVTGWEDFSAAFELLVKKEVKEGEMHPDAPIVVHKWFPGGHLLFYTARPLNKGVIAVGDLTDVHKFAWLNKTQKNLVLGMDAYFIQPSNLPANPNQLYGAYFEEISIPDTIPIIKKGVLLRNFYVYRLKKCKKIPASVLPNASKK